MRRLSRRPGCDVRESRDRVWSIPGGSERVSSALSAADAQIAVGPWADFGYSEGKQDYKIHISDEKFTRAPTSSLVVCLHSSLLVCCVQKCCFLFICENITRVPG